MPRPCGLAYLTQIFDQELLVRDQGTIGDYGQALPCQTEPWCRVGAQSSCQWMMAYSPRQRRVIVLVMAATMTSWRIR